jgi:hypothetical protein
MALRGVKKSMPGGPACTRVGLAFLLATNT